MFRQMLRRYGLLSVLFLSACGAPAPSAGPGTGASDVVVTRGAVPADAGRFAQLLNATRAKRGLPALTFDDALARAAAAHAADMARQGYFAHRSPSGSKPHQRIRRTGYSACATGEALAFNQPSAEVAFTDWMQSRGHRVILMGRYTHYGFASEGPYRVFVAARPC